MEALEQLTDADRAYCMVHDADRQVVWTQDLDSPHMREASATSGLISFVARTGVSVAVEQAGADARYDRAVDDPPGRGDERLLAEPVLAGRAAGGPGQVMAILVAVRDASRAPFTREERETMATLAGRVGADLARLDLKNQLEELSSHNEELLRQKPLQIFREEALDHYAHRRAVEGDVLRISPRWIGWTYWLLLLIAAAGLVFAVFGRVTETALGPAIVKVEGQTLITATTPGTVTRIAVRPGDSVTKGQVLVRFHDRQERAAVKRVQREYDLQLSKLLRNPGDSAAQQAVMGLRIQRQRAQASLDQRTVRAPAAGMVRDVRVPVGQHVMPGNILLTLAGDETRYKVVAMLPGHYRPLLFKRMTMRFELTGYRYTFQKVPINIISDGVISPAEAHRYLGKGPAEAVSLVGSVVMVEASLPSPTFSFQGQKHHFYDGMYGRSMVPVRSESILVSLLPSLKRIWGGVK